MLKNLLQQRNEVMYRSFTIFRQNVCKVKNSVDILGIRATALMIENPQIVNSYLKGHEIYIEGLHVGETTIILWDEQNEMAELKVTVDYVGTIFVEIIPFLKNMNTAFVYFKRSTHTSFVAVDLNEALYNYLIIACTNETLYTIVKFLAMFNLYSIGRSLSCKKSLFQV